MVQNIPTSRRQQIPSERHQLQYGFRSRVFGQLLLRCRYRFLRRILVKNLGSVVDGEPVLTPYGFAMMFRQKDSTNRTVFQKSLGTVATFIEAMPDNAFLLDIGGNQGATALLAAMKIGRKVVAFEPSARIFASLEENLALNRAGNIKAVNSGIAASQHDSFIDDGDTNHTGGSHIADSGSHIHLTTISVDDLEKWGIEDRPLYIKIDTEGFELEVLKGLAGILQNRVAEQIIVEIDARHLARYNTTPSQVYDFAAGSGYVPAFGLRPGHYEEIFERQQD